MTDCSTVFADNRCLGRLFSELHFRKDLIGVTARQRVASPSQYFRPCKGSWFPGDHNMDETKLCSNCMSEQVGRSTCMRCSLAYWLSPAPIQGYEFEATWMLNSSMFNLIEALPVMPGPCQLLNWDNLNHREIDYMYYDRLFDPHAPPKPKIKRRTIPPTTSDENPQHQSVTAMDLEQGVHYLASKKYRPKEILSNLVRLAEDRILSFESVLGSEKGVRWVSGASFYYLSEVTWVKLLKQRRRWINGTFAGVFLFFLTGQGARRVLEKVNHHQSRSRMVQLSWALQLYQLLITILAPAIFGSAVYLGMKECETLFPNAFGWFAQPVFPLQTDALSEIRVMEFFTIVFMLVYGIWINASFYYETFSEWKLVLMACFGGLSILPIYIAIWYSIFFKEFTEISALVVGSFLLPIVVALMQSWTSAQYYCLYLPHFLALTIAQLLFIPAYSFDRLWDTTWGNRPEKKDGKLQDDQENQLKLYNWIFNNFITAINFIEVWAFVKAVHHHNLALLILYFFTFLPWFVRLLFSFFYLFLGQPLKASQNNRDTKSKYK